MSKRKALGSGLEALLSAKSVVRQEVDNKNISKSSSTQISYIPVHEISRNKYKTRKVYFDEAL